MPSQSFSYGPYVAGQVTVINTDDVTPEVRALVADRDRWKARAQRQRELLARVASELADAARRNHVARAHVTITNTATDDWRECPIRTCKDALGLLEEVRGG